MPELLCYRGCRVVVKSSALKERGPTGGGIKMRHAYRRCNVRLFLNSQFFDSCYFILASLPRHVPAGPVARRRCKTRLQMFGIDKPNTGLHTAFDRRFSIPVQYHYQALTACFNKQVLMDIKVLKKAGLYTGYDHVKQIGRLKCWALILLLSGRSTARCCFEAL